MCFCLKLPTVVAYPVALLLDGATGTQCTLWGGQERVHPALCLNLQDTQEADTFLVKTAG